MLDWLIIGGGVHGTLLSRVLVAEAGVPPERVRVLDPHDEPLSRFRECAAATGMAHLRSTVVHHLDSEPMSLQRFVQQRRSPERDLLGPYLRPTVEVFDAHCREVIGRHGLRSLRCRGEATDLTRDRGAMRVETSEGSIRARNVVLAMGGMGEPSLPPWVRDLEGVNGRVCHIFEAGFKRADLSGRKRSVVVGGGLSAIQSALALADAGAAARVTLVARHGRRVHDFDTDSGWMGPKLERGFARVEDLNGRRSIIQRARHRGSTPRDVAERLRRRVESGDLRECRAEVVDAAVVDGELRLRLDDGTELSADSVLLATGFDARRPGGPWLDRAIERLGLQYAACGYPVVDRQLCWAPGIYVTGPLADLEIGPAARNIHGARLAGKKLLEVAKV